MILILKQTLTHTISIGLQGERLDSNIGLRNPILIVVYSIFIQDPVLARSFVSDSVKLISDAVQQTLKF